jgi:glycosyltransferase involved in cell wall biosynthesis
MKVELISTDFVPNIGGIAQHLVELGKALQFLGHDVEVLTTLYGGEWGRLRQAPFLEKTEGLPTYRIPYSANLSLPFISGQISTRLSERRFVRLALGRLAQRSPDIAHWHAIDLRNNPMPLWTGSPSVWTSHTTMFAEAARDPRNHAALLRRTEGTAEILTPAEEWKGLICSLGVPQAKVHFIPNGVDSARFAPGPASPEWRSRIGLAPGERLVLTTRRLVNKNGLRYLILAAALLLKEGVANVKYVLVGDDGGYTHDSATRELQNLIHQHRLEKHVLLAGRMENRDLPPLYRLADIVVVPSLEEATSLSASEAMAAGKPLIATTVGGLPFLVRDNENGFLVPPMDAPALARALRQLLADPSLAERMGRNGRARAQHELSWVEIAKQVVSIYEKAIRERAGPSSLPRA